MKLEKLTDAFLEGVIEQELFEERKAALLAKKREAQQVVGNIGDDAGPVVERLRKLLELADTALRTYETSEADEKRELLRITTSNLEANRKKGFVELSKPFSLIADRNSVPDSCQPRTKPRSLQFLPEAAERETDPVCRRMQGLLYELVETLENSDASVQLTEAGS